MKDNVKVNIIEYCVKKKRATMDYPFGPDPMVVRIEGKMFALIFENLERHTIINLKCDPVIADNLREQHDKVRPGYHMNKKHWNSVTLDGSVPEADLFFMIDHSYNLVVQSLSKSLRESILENN